MFYTNQTMQESNRKALNCQVYNITVIPNHDVKKKKKTVQEELLLSGKKYVRMHLQTRIHRTWKECIKADLKI